MGLIKVAEISIDKLEDRKTVTAILHENGYTVGPGKRKKTETGKQLDYYLKVYVEFCLVCAFLHIQGRTLQGNKRKNEGDSQEGDR